MQKLISSEKSDKKALIAIPDAPSLQTLFEEETVRFGYDVPTLNGDDRIWSFFEKEAPLLGHSG